MIQEELGDQQKSFGAFLMAAHLSPKDAQLWKRLGQTSMKFNHVDQAIYCLNRAARADPTDIDVLWDCASLNYQQANFQKVLRETKRDCLTQDNPLTEHILILPSPQLLIFIGY